MQNLISSIQLFAIAKQKPHTNSTPICQTPVTAQRHLNWRKKRSPKRFPQILWRQSTDIPASMGAIYVDISRWPTKDPNSCTTWQRTGWDECFDMVWQTACEIFLNAPNSLGRCLHFFSLVHVCSVHEVLTRCQISQGAFGNGETLVEVRVSWSCRKKWAAVVFWCRM